MKVYFAMSHSWDEYKIISKFGGRYCLGTYFTIHKRNLNYKKIDWDALGEFKGFIVDSGLFSIMFGCAKDEVFDYTFCQKYYKEYVGFINGLKNKNTFFVEMDVQKKLGSDYAWEL